MKLIYTDAEFPHSIISNDQILELIEQYSHKSFSGSLAKLLSQVNLLLEFSGAQSRRWMSCADEPGDAH